MAEKSHDYFLTTKRLGIRVWTKADLPLATVLWEDPDVTRFIGGPMRPDDIRRRLDAEIQNQMKENLQYWPVFEKETATFIGCCGFSPFRLDPQHLLEMGIHLLKPWWGTGYAWEAASAVLEHFANLNETRTIVAGHHPENERSRRLIMSLGFEPQEPLMYPPTGLLHPMYRWRK
jgi:[ribosomal protein S5]-alanine N-acetyltransferase